MRLVAVSGQKGGVGKTPTALALAAWLDGRALAWSGVDTDQENKGLYSLYPERVKPVTLMDAVGRLRSDEVQGFLDHVAGAAEAGTPVLLLDMGAAQLRAVFGQMDESGLLDSGLLALTLLFVIVNEPDSVTTLLNHQACLDGLSHAQFVVVRNAWKGPCALYDESRVLRPAMQQRGALEITLPKLAEEAVLPAVKRSGLTYRAYLDPANGQSWSYRGRLSKWLAAIAGEFDRIATVLT
jgi:hypothetical protein